MQKVLEKLPIQLLESNTLEISPRKSSYLKKAVIEEFLPRYAAGCEVLYIRDTANKILLIKEEKLNELKFSMPANEDLPDIIAYNKKKKWLYLIEAVCSFEAITEMRVLELKKMLKDCPAFLIFISAFISKTEFKKWMLDIA